MGCDLPLRPPKDDPSAYWLWIADICGIGARLVGYASPPDYLRYDLKEAWKEEREREVLEEAASLQARELIDKLLTGRALPRKEQPGTFFAQERLLFAQRLAKVFATKANFAKPDGVADSPAGDPIETIRWLAIDLYDAGHCREGRWTYRKYDRY